jgi:hypothetical protein
MRSGAHPAFRVMSEIAHSSLRLCSRVPPLAKATEDEADGAAARGVMSARCRQTVLLNQSGLRLGGCVGSCLPHPLRLSEASLVGQKHRA